MRKITLFLALMVAMVTTAFGQTPIQSADFNADNTYRIYNKATDKGDTGWMAFAPQDDPVGAMLKAYDANDEYQVWKFVANGTGYNIYNVKTERYLKAVTGNNNASGLASCVRMVGEQTSAGLYTMTPAADGQRFSFNVGPNKADYLWNDGNGLLCGWQEGSNELFYLELVEEGEEPVTPPATEEPEVTAKTPVLEYTASQIGTTYPYELPAEDADKVFALSDLTIAVKANTATFGNYRMALLAAVDPTKAKNTDAMGTNSYYLGFGFTNTSNMGMMASWKSGDRFGKGDVPANTENVVLVYVVSPSNGRAALYLNGTFVTEWTGTAYMNNPVYEFLTPAMVKADYKDAKIYLGGAKYSAGTNEAADEVFNGEIKGVQVYEGALTAEEIANITFKEEAVEPEPVVVGYRFSTNQMYLQVSGTSVKLRNLDESNEDQIFLIEEVEGMGIAIKGKNGGYIKVSRDGVISFDATAVMGTYLSVKESTDGFALYYGTMPLCVDMTGNLYMGMGSTTDPIAYWTREEVLGAGETPDQPTVEPIKVVKVTPDTPVGEIKEITIEFSDDIMSDPNYQDPANAGTGTDATTGTGTVYIYLGNQGNVLNVKSINGKVLTVGCDLAINTAGEYALIIKEGRIVRASDNTPVVLTKDDNVKFTIEGGPKMTTKNVKATTELTNIQLKFDSEIELAAEHNVTEINVYVKGTETVAGTINLAGVTIDENDNKVINLPLKDAIAPAETTTYTVSIPANWIVKKSNGKAFEGKKNLECQVQIPLAIVNINPTTGSTVEAIENIVIEYNQAVTKYATAIVKLVNKADNSEIALDAAVEGKVLTLTPTAAVPNGEYTFNNQITWIVYDAVGTQAKDPNYTITVNAPVAAEPIEPSDVEFGIDQDGLSSITFYFEENVTADDAEVYATVYDADNNEVLVFNEKTQYATNPKKIMFNNEYWESVTALGTYKIVVTANIKSESGKVFKGGEYTAAIELSISADYEEWESVMSYVPTEAGIMANAEFTVDKEKKVTMTVNGNTYEAQVEAEGTYIGIYFGEDLPEVKDAEYTFTIPEGFYTVNGVANEEVVKTFTYELPKPIVLCDMNWAEISTEFTQIDKIYVVGQNYGSLYANEAEDAPKAYIISDVEGAEPVYATIAWDNQAYLNALTFDPAITEYGTYTLVFPAGVFYDIDVEVRYTLTVGEAEEVEPLTFTITPAAGKVEAISEIHVVYSDIITPANWQIKVYGADGTEYIFQDSYADLPWNEIKYVPADGNAITAAGTYTVYGADLGVYYNDAPVSFDGEDYTWTIGEAETAIEGVDAEAEDAVIYDIAGRRIEKITNAGIYIVNGKKVVVK